MFVLINIYKIYVRNCIYYEITSSENIEGQEICYVKCSFNMQKMVHPLHSKTSFIFMLLSLESFITQNASIDSLKTTLNEKEGKICVNYFLYILFNDKN